jgi:hypothetical protein
MKDTIELAREAGIDLYGLGANHERFVGVIKAFEALVRADERDRAMRENAYVQAEREACAVIAETPISGEQDDVTMQAKDRVAEAIRARGTHDPA